MSRDKENNSATQEFKFDSGEFMRADEVARKLNVSRVFVLRLLRRGKLPGFKLGHCWIVSKSALQQFLLTLVAKRQKNQKRTEQY
jgi:excisionase family DNA binding protein